MTTPETDPGAVVTMSGSDFALLQDELEMLRLHLHLVVLNLRRGLSKNSQRQQAKAIAEVLAGGCGHAGITALALALGGQE